MPRKKVVEVAVPESNDQRTRVGLEKREKTRKRLLSAVMSSYAEAKVHVPPNIDDVARAANVSRQTFYLYFTSLEDAISKLGQQFAEEMSFNMESFPKLYRGPLHSLTGGILIFLLRSVTDPIWGAFLSRTHHFSNDTHLIKVVRRDLTMAKDANLIQFDDLDAATDFYVGSVQRGVGRLVNSNEHSRAYVENFATMILLGLQVPYEEAREIVSERGIHIRGLAPDCFPWWRDPWIPKSANDL